MIDKLRAIAIFGAVVNQGSFRGAARNLGLSPSRVSETISDLENSLGVTLLYRSTRQLSLTHEGRLLHGKAKEMIAAAESGLDAINPHSKEPSGALRVTAPKFVTQSHLMDDFSQFSKSFPKIDIEFHFSDHPSNLIKDNFDVGIRVGLLEDSDLITRNIGQMERLLVASPDYVKHKGNPKRPADLEEWDWIRFVVRPNMVELTGADGKTHAISGRSHISVNSAEALYEFAMRGLGVTGIPDQLAFQGFERGDLIHVLPDWKLPPLDMQAFWPNNAKRENLTNLFVRFLAKAKN